MPTDAELADLADTQRVLWNIGRRSSVGCGTVRPGTLGHQVCRVHHESQHESQDGGRWDFGTPVSASLVEGTTNE